MQAATSLDSMLAAQTIWHAGRHPAAASEGEPTGHAALDDLLPQRGWPRRALTELLLPADGIGELALLMPTLARLSGEGSTLVEGTEGQPFVGMKHLARADVELADDEPFVSDLPARSALAARLRGGARLAAAGGCAGLAALAGGRGQRRLPRLRAARPQARGESVAGRAAARIPLQCR